ncbi:hypothetical protein FRX31_016653 [Thalictrum thalictroides]|uniref:Uncharacterized protein n=1 Tax=Thalictrum thalictroides TaxID=46969 RepID=A0A7J6WA60_THATH|nr:hypothetical protein FRX31_016653 [Thalictrum thalictroides]
MAYSKLSLTAALLVFSMLVSTIPSGNAGKIVTQWKWIGKCRSLQQCRISCLAKGYGNQYTDVYDFLVMLDLEKTSTVCGCPLVYKEDSWQSDLPATKRSACNNKFRY